MTVESLPDGACASIDVPALVRRVQALVQLRLRQAPRVDAPASGSPGRSIYLQQIETASWIPLALQQPERWGVCAGTQHEAASAREDAQRRV